MKKRLSVITWIFMGFLIIGNGWCDPKDKSLKAWEAVKKEVNLEAEAELEKRFKPEMERILKIGEEVYKPGEVVEVMIVTGRPRKVKGMFHQILVRNGEYMAEISDDKYLLSDLSLKDRNKLLFGAKPELLPAYKAKLMKELENEKSGLRKQLRTKGYTEKGYDGMFLATSLLMGDRFYSKEDLGIGKMRFYLESSRDRRPCARFILEINSELVDGVVVVWLGEKAIAASTTEFMNPKDGELSKLRLTGYISKEDLGVDPAARVLDKMRVQFANISTANMSWTVKPTGADRSKTITRSEHIGGKEVKIQYSLDTMKFYLVADSFINLEQSPDLLDSFKIGILKAKGYQRDALDSMKPFLKMLTPPDAEKDEDKEEKKEEKEGSKAADK